VVLTVVRLVRFVSVRPSMMGGHFASACLDTRGLISASGPVQSAGNIKSNMFEAGQQRDLAAPSRDASAVPDRRANAWGLTTASARDLHRDGLQGVWCNLKSCAQNIDESHAYAT
jgi:hypothetical protein